jgi:phage protein D
VEALKKPAFVLLYNSRDITQDVSKYLLSITYTDKDQGESDELDITVEDVDGFWRNTWYPQKKDTLQLSIGYDNGTLTDCGTFEIDEITLSGPPDVVTIKSLAAGISKAMRTKNSQSFENLTLRQIAQFIASKHRFTLLGSIGNIKFNRVTQKKETDLGFLHRVSSDYGFLFSVRNKQLIFTSVFEIENGSSVIEIDRTELRTYSLKDKTSETYKEANVKYHDPKHKESERGKSYDLAK